MNQNEQQPERTAMQQALNAYNDLGHLIVAISLDNKVPKHIRLQLSNESNKFYLKFKELRDTVDKEQWIAAYVEGLRDCQTGYTNQYTSTDHDLNKIRDFAESRFNQKYGTDGKDDTGF